MIPRKVQIGGHEYKIKQVGFRELGKDKTADVTEHTNTIRLYKRAAATRKIELLLHESLHAMLFVHNIQGEEKVVSILGEALTDFIRQNPEFILHALKTLRQD